MRAALAKADIGGGVVVDLAKATGIEKADDRRLARKIEHTRGLGAGAKAAADLGIAGLRQLSDDGGLAALHLAKQPNHGSKAACPLRNRLLKIGGGAHRGQNDRAPRRNKQAFSHSRYGPASCRPGAPLSAPAKQGRRCLTTPPLFILSGICPGSSGLAAKVLAAEERPAKLSAS